MWASARLEQNAMKLNVKCTGKHKPKCMTVGSAGIDLYNNGQDVTVHGYGTYEVKTMTAFEIPEGYVGLVFVRSGLGWKGLDLINSCGVIDSDYRGNIGLKFINHTETPIELKNGDRVAQIVIVPYFKATELNFVEELSETARGANGFGSTGGK